MKQKIIQEIKESIKLKESITVDQHLILQIERVANLIVEALNAGGKILVAGNGGSAADAQHIVGELVNRFMFDRPPLSGIALSTDTSVLTAVSNDYGYSFVFAKQVEALARENDLFLAISTSGNAENIIKALESAKKLGVKTVGMSGETGGKMFGLCDECICVPSTATPRIQEAHITIAHIICGLVESAVFGPKQKSCE
ncbi:MAG: D-sedoheptulose 7-phosphate isomerase [Lentisphaerae bacterium]|nr:D-sedoheptulose 7-phosphate isomerase [Lentisphaerota bacterium]